MRKHSYLEVLRQHLDADSINALEALVNQRGDLPFEYDPTTKRFEPALDEFDPETTDENFFDTVLTACDILSAHIDSLDLQSVSHTAPTKVGQTDLQFSFDSDDPQLEVFYKLIRPLTKDNEIAVNLNKQPGIVTVVVTLYYFGEQDYQQKKDRHGENHTDFSFQP
jgi:hypothetical protein